MSETTKKPTTRRDLISAAGYTTLASTAAMAIAKPDAQAVDVLPTAHGADVQLIALGDQFMALRAHLDAIDAGLVDISDGDVHDIISAQAVLLDTMAEHVACTAAAHRARARTLAAWYGIGGDPSCRSEIDEDRIWPLFRDLIGSAV